ncbi:NUDIX hydrolase [Nitratireductor soli]|uniref:NUDIX hydrolase n=1 Tax=Nitratireductor soli TaxID=1670619 RepID=UPI00065E0D7E|nr:NUDIX hydrolase [Nitratireductor soli]
MTIVHVRAPTAAKRRTVGPAMRTIAVDCRLLIEDRHRRVLLARYRAGGYAAQWMLPGGSVLPGEAMALAATRRLHEQLGILVLPHCIISVFDDALCPFNGSRLIVTYAASVLSGAATADPSTGIAEAAWFPRGNLPEDVAADAGEALASAGAIGFR